MNQASSSVEPRIELLHFDRPTLEQYRNLLEDAAVNRYLPLASESYSDQWILDWISRKRMIWGNPELGPWSVWLNGEFAGWAGVEPDGEILSLGAVLHKHSWGNGRAILQAVCRKVSQLFPEAIELEVELPVARGSARFASRLGLVRVGEKDIQGFSFDAYRLNIQKFLE